MDNPTIHSLVDIDLTAGNHDLSAGHWNLLQAVAGSGLVKITLKDGTTSTLFLFQGDWLRADFATIVAVGTDAVFTGAAGALVGASDRTDV